MISLLQRKSFKFLHPILKKVAKIYLSKPRNYTYQGIIVKVLPGVFHPGLFFSTKVVIEFLEKLDLSGKKVLELGAGSGLVSIYCSQKGAKVTASDISPVAVEGLKVNTLNNDEQITIVLSDLFDKLNAGDFDIILINPPYYPKNPRSIEDQAWFCGEQFEYFQKLFQQLKTINTNCKAYMVLSEDCDLTKIMSIAERNGLTHKQVFSKKVNVEENYVFEIKRV